MAKEAKRALETLRTDSCATLDKAVRPKDVNEGKLLIETARRSGYQVVTGGYNIMIGGQKVYVPGDPTEMPSNAVVIKVFGLPDDSPRSRTGYWH